MQSSRYQHCNQSYDSVMPASLPKKPKLCRRLKGPQSYVSPQCCQSTAEHSMLTSSAQNSGTLYNSCLQPVLQMASPSDSGTNAYSDSGCSASRVPTVVAREAVTCQAANFGLADPFTGHQTNSYLMCHDTMFVSGYCRSLGYTNNCHCTLCLSDVSTPMSQLGVLEGSFLNF